MFYTVSALFISIVAFVAACFAFARAYADHRRVSREIFQLQNQTSDLQRMLQLRGNLANEIAHEIKNPLTAILCSAETLDLLLGPKLESDHRQSLRYIREYGESLLRLVSDFLDVSRAESGLIDCDPKQVEVQPAAEAVLGLLKANAIRKKIELECINNMGPVECWADARQLKQILFNLAHNAIKFTPVEGKVTISIGARSASMVEIEVTDNGPGIPESEVSKLFKLYSRYESEETRAQVGIGLGLALCRELAELNGGSISVRSQVGVGTTFVLQLRAVSPDKSQIGAVTSTMLIRQAAEQRPLAGQKFLLVDQDNVARTAMSKLIEAWGGLADGVAEAADAVRALEHRAYDAVMIEAEANPALSADLARRIREDAQCRGTTVILAGDTAKLSKTEIELAHRCVPKPLNGNVLLRSLLNSGRSHKAQ